MFILKTLTQQVFSHFHAPRAGSDRLKCTGPIHAPRGGSDDHPGPTGIFQSTLPVRGATGPAPSKGSSPVFNPRSPCGERLIGQMPRPDNWFFSIHAPRGGATLRSWCTVWTEQFQSTLPAGGHISTKKRPKDISERSYSIHIVHKKSRRLILFLFSFAKISCCIFQKFGANPSKKS